MIQYFVKWKMQSCDGKSIQLRQHRPPHHNRSRRKAPSWKSWQLVEHEFETTGSNRAQTLPAFHEGAFLRRTFVDQIRPATTHFRLLNFKSVSNSPNCLNILRLRRIKLDLLPDLLNMHRNRSNIPHRLHIPDLPE